MKKLIYIAICLLVVSLTACKNDNDEPQATDGQTITLNFSLAGDINEPAEAPARKLPGDPGKDDFVAPQYLYFVVWAQAKGGGQIYMKAIKETLTAANWTDQKNGTYLLNKSYNLTLPKNGANIQTLENDAFYVFAYTSATDFTAANGFTYGSYTAKELLPNSTVTRATLEALTYSKPSLPAGTTASDFFRSVYSTALGETSHNQMATTTTIVLRHTASRLDLNWECDETTHPKGLTAGSTLTLSTANYPTSFSLFEPGKNTGATNWNEVITIDQGNKYNGRYVTYLPMPATPTFTVTSSIDNINGASQTKSFTLTAGADDDYATWMRALWTIK